MWNEIGGICVLISICVNNDLQQWERLDMFVVYDLGVLIAVTIVPVDFFVLVAISWLTAWGETFRVLGGTRLSIHQGCISLSQS